MNRQGGELRRWLREALAEPDRLRDTVLVIGAALISAGLIFGLLYDVFDSALRRWSERDLARRAELIGAAVAPVGSHSRETLHNRFNELGLGPDGGGIAVCTAAGQAISVGLGNGIDCSSALAASARAAGSSGVRASLADRQVIVTGHVQKDGSDLFVVQDRSAVAARRKHLLQILFAAAELALLALLLLARASARLAARRTGEAARSFVQQMRTQEVHEAPVPPELRLLIRDVRDTVEHLRRRDSGGAERLRRLVEERAGAGSLVVIANREPYSHEHDANGRVQVKKPASGLVTGIEPVLKASGGTWIAHSSGSANRSVSGRDGRVAVPPDAPEYTLRRLFTEEEEYQRYYCGAANEALWPLCHRAFAQPVFRSSDWDAYRSVNEQFARAAVEDAGDEGLILIQDYHFALVPRLVRESASQVVTSLFWHIPWPSPDAFSICPWRESLLEGMTGADIVGFHTRQHALNFLSSLQQTLECRVDFEEMSVAFAGRTTLVRTYPISVEWPYPAEPRSRGDALRRTYGISPDAHVMLGVDRADYTKGLLERIAAVEELFASNPSLIGKYVLVQLASPTRDSIDRYRNLASELQAAVERVNARFGKGSWRPVHLQMKTFSQDEVRVHYAMADSALVTPLHDGMNLVAKEYAASCEDGDGVLILSQFAGAARELDGALVVNPYDSHEMAQAILRAVHMPLTERRARMRSMRDQIASHSIFDWSAALLTDMTDVRRRRQRFWPQLAPARRDPAEVVAG